MQEEEKTIPIPVRFKSGAFGLRNCTRIYPIARYIRKLGAKTSNPFYQGLGISTDEVHRAKTSRKKSIINDYPLLTLGLSREDCIEIISNSSSSKE